MVAEIEANETSLICTACVNINAENMDIAKRRKISVPTGATILMFHDRKTNPVKAESFRGIIEAQWINIKNRDIDTHEVPCILGAAYGVKKHWYTYIDGFAGHRLWGTLEPYISLKSWMFGGSCLCASRIETAHIFKKLGTHGTPQDVLMYNKMFVSLVLLKDASRMINFLGSNSILTRAHAMIKDNIDYIREKQKEYRAKIVVDEYELFERLNIDYRVKQLINK